MIRLESLHTWSHCNSNFTIIHTTESEITCWPIHKSTFPSIETNSRFEDGQEWRGEKRACVRGYLGEAAHSAALLQGRVYHASVDPSQLRVEHSSVRCDSLCVELVRASQRHGQLSIQLCLCMRVCVYVRTYTHAWVCVHACVCTNAYVCGVWAYGGIRVDTRVCVRVELQ